MSDTKACPFCGEEVLTVAIKCKHCGSSIGAAPPLASPTPPAAAAPKTRWGVIGVTVVGAVLILGAWNWSRTGSPTGQGFTQADVANVEQSIRAELAKDRHVTVEEVSMMKVSPTELTGFAKVRMPLIGEINKNCTATRGEGKYMWQCR